MSASLSQDTRPWVKRLRLPAYQVKDAARLARVAPRTIRNWQAAQSEFAPAVAMREDRESLSYLHLVELRFVAAMRVLKLSLRKIRLAREYLATKYQTDFPFADSRLRSDGQDIILHLDDEGPEFRHLVIIANRGGQYAWKPILGEAFAEFDYDDKLGIATRWHVEGRDSPIIVDPQIAFGTPIIKGVPTWALLARWKAGETVKEIARDFALNMALVRRALKFEGIDEKEAKKLPAWNH